jgi:hypothetical protein
MANTVSTITYANTFGEWVVSTQGVVTEVNTLGKSNYTKDSGTLYLNETTQKSLIANGDILATAQLLVQGVGSSATIQNNLTVQGQVYFSNTTLGLTNSGQANINGLLVAQGPNTSLYVANSATVNSNLTVRLNTTTDKLQANTSVNTATLQAVTSIYTPTISVSANTYTDKLIANTNVTTPDLVVNGKTYTENLQANVNIISPAINITGTTTTNILKSNTTIDANGITLSGNTITNNLKSNNSINTAILYVSNNIEAANADAKFNNLYANGQFTVQGNFVLNGVTVYNSPTFTLNSGSAVGLNSSLVVNRGTSGTNAEIRWNETSAWFEYRNVANNNYYRFITSDILSNDITSTSTSSAASIGSVNTVNKFAQAAYNKANAGGLTLTGTSGFYTSNSITLSSNNGVTIVATGSNTFAISTPQDLRTSASPSFTALSLTGTALGDSSGGTGSQTFQGAFNNLIKAATGGLGTSGYVLTTNGTEQGYYWAAGGTGGGGGATPGSTIVSSRLSYSGDNSTTKFTTPTFNQNNQLRAYINGVRQFENQYQANTSNSTIIFSSAPQIGDSILIEVDGYLLSQTYFANNIPFTAPVGGIPSAANTIQLAIESVESRKASLANVSTFLADVRGITMPSGTSNTSFATTAYVQNLANSSGTLITNITGKAGSINFTSTSPNLIYAGHPTGTVFSQTFRQMVMNDLPEGLIGPLSTGQNGYVWASPSADSDNGNGTMTSGVSFRRLVAGDIPSLPYLSSSTTVYSNAYIGNTQVSFNRTSGALTLSGVSIDGNAGSATTATTATTASYATTANSTLTSANFTMNALGVGTTASTVAGEIRAANNITAYYTSDKKFKENIQDIPNALNKVESIGGKLFDWTDEYIQEHGGEDGYFVQKSDFGVIAQDVKQVFPVATRIKDDGTLVVDYEKLCALAFAAIKELKEEVEILKGQIK